MGRAGETGWMDIEQVGGCRIDFYLFIKLG